MRLYIGIGRSKQLFSTLYGNSLYFIYYLTASIIAFAGIALSIFIGQN